MDVNEEVNHAGSNPALTTIWLYNCEDRNRSSEWVNDGDMFMMLLILGSEKCVQSI